MEFLNHIVNAAPILMLIVIFYFFLVRPQQKKDNEKLEMLKALKKGDEVLLSSGIVGFINEIKNTEIKNEIQKLNLANLEIANGVIIKIDCSAIIKKINS